MTAQMVETRAPAREAPVGALIDWQQHGWSEVVIRSNGPDAAVLRTSDGRLVEVMPGEVVDMRYVGPEVEQPVPAGGLPGDESVGSVNTNAQEPATPIDDWLIREIDTVMARLQGIRQALVARIEGADPTAGLLSADDVAAKAGIKAETVRVYARQRLIPCVKIGQSLWFDPAATDAWLGRRTLRGQRTNRRIVAA